jgi:hypothetical protein
MIKLADCEREWQSEFAHYLVHWRFLSAVAAPAFYFSASQNFKIE